MRANEHRTSNVERRTSNFERSTCNTQRSTFNVQHSTGSLLLLVAVASLTISAAEPTPEQLDFFEKRIRPVLVDSCYQCHSAERDKAKGGMQLDTRAALLKGGDSGPVIVPGKPDASRLIKAVRYTDEDLQMPPKSAGGQLPAERIADLEAWIRMGAPDPRTGQTSSKPGYPDPAKARAHWAFTPVAAPPVPTVKNKAWVKTPVDAFVLFKLEARKLKPTSPADPHSLLRRLYFDLIGLPPTPQEMDAFVKDTSPVAYERVVDTLLASPRYGERWGRYWLDVARYADTKGYVFQEERRYPYSHTYRDYVIKAFNDDKPYDRFVQEQLAADRLVTGKDKSALAAMGFLTLGRRFLNDQNDIIDDRIDVTTRGLMGLTVSCARCHDHKFDPIPTKDYYSLHGIFASSLEPEEKPLLKPLNDTPDYQAFLKKKAEITAQIRSVAVAEAEKFLTAERAKVGTYLLAARDAKNLPKDKTLETFAGERKVIPKILRQWMTLLEGRDQADPVLAPWLVLAQVPETDFANQVKILVACFATNRVNPIVAQAFGKAPPASIKDAAALYNQLFADTDRAWQAARTNRPAPASLANADQEAIRQLLYAEHAPANLPGSEAESLIARQIDNATVGHRQQIEALNWTHPGAPLRAMALTDSASPHNSRVLLRGNPGNPGPEVLRQFPEILAGPQRRAFTNGSGRLELAQAIASRGNPLTARVFVNRVWGWHFGTALVRTPSDFGARSETPAQLDLLNWLAADFMDHGWSVKALHRVILLSNTYRQASDAAPRTMALDPENQLLGHFNRRRLDFEAMRDTLLALSGRLDLSAGGLPVDILTEPFSARRTIYGFIDRQNLPGLFRTFDFANPDASSPGRFTTTVPQQALFMMNSPFVVQQAQQLARRLDIKDAGGELPTINALYRLLFQRAPDKDELKLAQQFLHAQTARALNEQPVWQYGSAQFDESNGHVTYFRRFTNYTAKSGWHAEAKFPGEQSGWVLINAAGGHPGATPKLASVRRWTAPTAGVVTVEGTLKHTGKQGDGVRGRIVSSRHGLMGRWKVFDSSATTPLARLEIEAGETVDFVVDCLGSVEFDSYHWAPVIRYVSGDHASMPRTEFNAEKDFKGPGQSPAPLSAWEKYAQALLLSNELAFVD